jgi:hypothetical protein
LNFDSNYSASVTPTPTATGTILKVVMNGASTELPGFDADAVRGFFLFSGSAPLENAILTPLMPCQLLQATTTQLIQSLSTSLVHTLKLVH